MGSSHAPKNMMIVINSTKPGEWSSGEGLAHMASPAWNVTEVLSGVRLAQVRGGKARGFGADGVVWFGPGEEHWHGADPQSGFSYLSVQLWQDGRNVDWLQDGEQSR